MAKKSAKKRVTVKKTAAKKTPKRAKSKKAAPKVSAAQAVENRDGALKISKKALKDLISKGTKQGYLTYDEINEVLPEDALSAEQIEDAFRRSRY